MKSQLESWLLQYLPQSNQVKHQYQFIWLSLVIGTVSLWYSSLQHQVLDHHLYLAISIYILYLIFNAFLFLNIRRKQVSPLRVLSIISLIILAVLLSMVAEGDINSSVYGVFFLIMLAATRCFGVSYLLATFLFILVGQLITAAFIGTPDLSTFALHQLILSIAPIVAIIVSKQAQPASFLHENLLSTMNQSPLPMFTYELINNEPKIRFANTKAYQIFTNEPTDFKGFSAHKLAITEDAKEMRQHCIDALLRTDGEHGHRFFIRGRDSQGEIMQFMCVASSLLWLGQHIGVCFLIDITQIEKQRQKMNNSLHEGYMSTLVAGIVHDFRNVLTNMIGTAEVLAFSLDDKDAQAQLQRIIHAGEQGSETITHLLQLSALQKEDSTQSYLNICDSIQSIVELLRIQIPKHIQLDCIIEDNLPYIQINVSELEQVLMNLVNNAVQSIEEQGKISITIQAQIKNRLGNQPSQHLCITVADNGKGISDDDLPFITKSFWTTRKGEGGTGLGLAMVKRIIDQHHGSLNISSTLHQGTTVQICIPGKEVNIETKTPKHNDSEHLTCKPCTILLVDDSLEILEVYRMLLETMGHTVLTASSAKLAISIYDKENIDLLITDLRMPSMDGFELAMSLREKQDNLPILIVSAYDKIENNSNLESLNIHVLLKPATFPKLHQAIAQVQRNNPSIFS